MKKGWTYKKLGEVCEIISGQSPDGKYYNTDGIGTPFYQGKKDFTLKYIGEPTMWTTNETKIAEKDDLLMSVRAPVGDVNFATQRLCIGRGLAAIRTKGIVDKDFLFFFLLGKKNIIKGKEGVGFASINRKEIMDIDIQYPKDYSEQQRIVSRLDSAFANIDALKANAEKQLTEARALFQKALAKAMEPKEGWKEMPLNKVSSYSIGLTYKPSDVSESGTIVLRSSNIQNEKLDLSDLVRVKCPIKESLYAQEGDILMCSRNGSAKLVGKVAVIPKLTERVTYGTFMMIIHSVYNPYLFYFFQSESFRKQIKHGEANMINQITRYMLDDVLVNVPQITEMEGIVSRLDSLSENIKKLEEILRKTIAECDALKQAMLRKVFE